jgi:sialate O-acetylesterase
MAPAIFVLLLFTGISCGAALRLPGIFGDNMILQRDTNVPVWGWADPGEKVTVSVAGQTKDAVADSNGKWMVKLDPLEASSTPQTMTVSSSEISKSPNLQIENILVGDVWVCCGQSNMFMYIAGLPNWNAVAAKADYPKIRFMNQAATAALEPQTDLVRVNKNGWEICTPKSVPALTAVGYYFGKELHTTLNVPIGLISNSLSGSVAEAWTSREALQSDPELNVSLDVWDKYLQKYASIMLEQTLPTLQTWAKLAEQAKSSGQPLPMPPTQELLRYPVLSSNAANPPTSPNKLSFPFDPRTDADVNWRMATGLYNGTIMPLTPFAIKGVIWYQGEHNADHPVQYRKLLPAMITSWRKAWGQGDFPFLIVQLPNYYAQVPDPQESAWAMTREAQCMTLSLPNTGIAVTIDVGEAADIHPKNKLDVGKRLALTALGKVYGQKIGYSGPVYDKMEIQNDSILLHFSHVGSGLVSKDGGQLKGFAICGTDRKFVWANASVVTSASSGAADTIVVRSDKISKPESVRYAWANNPVCNLTNDTGLPACPFRTDNW